MARNSVLLSKEKLFVLWFALYLWNVVDLISSCPRALASRNSLCVNAKSTYARAMEQHILAHSSSKWLGWNIQLLNVPQESKDLQLTFVCFSLSLFFRAQPPAFPYLWDYRDILPNGIASNRHDRPSRPAAGFFTKSFLLSDPGPNGGISHHQFTHHCCFLNHTLFSAEVLQERKAQGLILKTYRYIYFCKHV